ncbi:putative T7SS-secreted protein [Haloechinothrix sp. LS1_15]|uniref:putative T7SS-secreted protein n=1 Tax=Haloechinothrix sp. LS1_15 TaxID=2652248 RepID=UPI0029452E45|nr:hypothetical protein [Haloechinothrix sp. LS1_15]MDV6011099.1 hypothetical protein [Haloechinothrix sp. LS1_15]
MATPQIRRPDGSGGDAGNFPGIGFDPAHGDVGVVDEFATQFLYTAECAGRAHEAMSSVLRGQHDVWFGQAAAAFADELDDLPRYIDKARESLELAGKALLAWSDQLRQHQWRAVEIEGEIQNLLRKFDQANDYLERTRQHWNAQPDDPSAASAFETALRSANTIADRIEQLRREARDDLMERWRDDGTRCARALDEAGAIAPDVGRFERFGDAFRGMIGTIGDVAGIVAAIAGVLAFIPVLTPIMAPIALVAGGVALAANATDMALNGNWDDPMAWVGLGGDVLGVVPGVGAAMRGARCAPGSGRGYRRRADGDAWRRSREQTTDHFASAGSIGCGDGLRAARRRVLQGDDVTRGSGGHRRGQRQRRGIGNRNRVRNDTQRNRGAALMTTAGEESVDQLYFTVPDVFREIELDGDPEDRVARTFDRLGSTLGGATPEQCGSLTVQQELAIAQLRQHSAVYAATCLVRTEDEPPRLSTAQFTLCVREAKLDGERPLIALADGLRLPGSAREVAFADFPAGQAVLVGEEVEVHMPYSVDGREEPRTHRIRQAQVILPLPGNRKIAVFGIASQCLHEWRYYAAMLNDIAYSVAFTPPTEPGDSSISAVLG